MKPKISIIIPFLNSESTLRRAIDSVISQSFSDWELILIDDGSQDYSDQIAQAFLVDSRVSLFSQTNLGVSAARNFGASKAKGKWLVFLDSDDQLRPNFFELVEKKIKNLPDIDFLAFGINRIKGNQEEILFPIDGQYFSRIPGTFVLRKSIFDRVEGYDERFRFSENTELFHRIGLMNSKGKNIPWISLNYFDNPTGGSKDIKNMVESLSLFLEKHSKTLTPHVKHLYNQIIGVNLLRFGEFANARTFFWRSILAKPTSVQTWLRYFISWLPFFSKRIYPID